jgi:asparagine synthase (glutamine-hydrolysing)
MCGISGIATRRLERAELQPLIGRMARAIRHRGPDGLDFRFFAPPAISQNVALAHNRLAVIDVSSEGREPMTNEDGTVWLVFNGEIYNFEVLNLVAISFIPTQTRKSSSICTRKPVPPA